MKTRNQLEAEYKAAAKEWKIAAAGMDEIAFAAASVRYDAANHALATHKAAHPTSSERSEMWRMSATQYRD